jgi:hypothetical protein
MVFTKGSFLSINTDIEDKNIRQRCTKRAIVVMASSGWDSEAPRFCRDCQTPAPFSG